MLTVLAKLSHLTGDDRFRLRAEALIKAFDVDAMRHFPHTCAFLNGFELFADALQVIIVGDRKDGAVQTLLRAVLQDSRPNLILSTADATDVLPAGHVAFGKEPVDGKAAAYVCRGPVCQTPVTTAEALRRALKN
jgi:uncharacterized protein YyaL (SSP411 family)